MKLHKHGKTIQSPGKSFAYEIIGACCRLYDREELPYPSCSLQWKGKQPSWNRVGKRFIPDVSCKRNPSYSVILLEIENGKLFPKVITLHWESLTESEREWWVTPSCKMQHYINEMELVAA